MTRILPAGRLDRMAVLGLTAFAAVFLFVTIAQPIDTDARRLFSDVALSGITLASGLVIVITALRMGGRSRVSWGLLGLGTLSWSGGMLAWSWYELVLQVETPFPSLADLGYLLMFPFMFAGLITLPAGRVRVEGRIKIALDALIVVVGFTTAAWITLLAPLYADAESTVVERMISLAYPLGDLLLLAALIGGAARGWIGRRDPALLPLTLGIAMLIAADVGFAWLTQHDAYGSGSPIDLGWPLGHMLVALAASRRARSQAIVEVPRPSTERNRWATMVRLLAPYLSVLIAAGLAIATVAPELDITQTVLFGLASTTVLLATVRQFMTVRENDRLNGELRVFSAALETLAAERTERLALLHDMASDLGGAGTRHASTAELNRVSQMIARQINVKYAVIFETAPAGKLQALATNVPIGDEAELAALTELGAAAARAGSPVGLHGGATASPAGTPARVGVPLPGARGSLGAICISADPGRTYADEDQHFLESVANLVGLTLERVHAVDELRHEHAQSFQLLRAVPSVLIGTDGNGIVHLWNQAAAETLSLTSEAVIGRHLTESALPVDMGDIQRRMGRAVNVGAPVTDDLRFSRADGSKGYMSLTVTRVVDEDARPAGHLLVGTDITQRRELEEQLRHQALHDPLTDLANRALFRDRLEHALSRFQDDLPSLAVLFIDLDDFKAVNDSLGHQMGDRLLTAAAARLQTTLRPSDTLARLGGDEFAILLEGVDSREVDRVVADLLREMSRPFKIDDRELRLSASVGMATPLSESETADDLLRNADIAMYAAKERGKARSAVFDATLHSQALERIELESDLRVAVERNELRVDFQPIVELTTGEATGAEALVRWQHPTRGLMSPILFIPTAERSGQVSAIDLWVLRQACAQIQDWNQLPDRVPLHIAVNLSRTDLDRPEVVDEVRDTLADFDIDPSSIVLEVTESALAEDMEGAIERLKALKTTGVRIAVDDFGTGYSSLGSLQHLPVDILKIDKSFVDALEDGSPEGEEVVSAIIRIARVLKLQTIAEGVETWAQAQRLRRLGCDLGQGYYFARPMAAEAAWRVIEESRAAQQHTA